MSDQVFVAMAESLAQGGPAGVGQLEWVRAEVIEALEAKYSEAGEHVLPDLRRLHYKLLQIAKTARPTAGTLDLRRGLFRCARLLGEDLSGGNLEEANFWQADLHKTRFDHTALRSALFMQANLRFASFRGADLRGADFRGADLWRADFAGAKGVEPEKFARSRWKEAIFDPPVRRALEGLFPSNGTRDEREKGRQECRAIGRAG